MSKLSAGQRKMISDRVQMLSASALPLNGNISDLAEALEELANRYLDLSELLLAMNDSSRNIYDPSVRRLGGSAPKIKPHLVAESRSKGAQ